MRFYFVDGITEIGTGRIVGFLAGNKGSPLEMRNQRGERCVSPSILSEAIGQLASWLVIEKTGFASRPVFLLAEETDFADFAPLGKTVEIRATLSHLNGEIVRFSGEASVEGRLVHSIRECTCYLMPLAELEDPDIARARFNELLASRPTESGSPPEVSPGLGGFDGYKVSDDGTTVTASRQFSAGEWFFRDHFPRFPVTPIVVLNEMIGQVAAQWAESKGIRAIPRKVRGLKIKHFVRPEDRCQVRVRFEGGRSLDGDLSAVAQIQLDGKTVLRGSYTFSCEQEAPNA